MIRISFLLLALTTGSILFAQDKPIVKGMKITKSTKFRKGVYRIDAPAAMTSAAIVITGDNIIIDFNQATLTGSNAKKRPDEFFGTGIIVRNSKNVTIRNLRASGYRVALLATQVENLTLENCDFSYNYRPQLNSTQEKEDLSDWMSYHHNENDEWLRYGAAFYLRDCNNATIRNCRVTGGQNALMLTRCNDGMIYNNEFSFNSGIGIGMYRSSRNKILYNKVIFNVRGYSHGIYNRGQDSAGMLVYEQSSNNLLYRNNVTHGGDGFFLWAGQSTMDSGEGGCNDNVLLRNDFSYAPTNGVEATFSRNTIAYNRIFECDHGIWGGYSYGSNINNNNFRNNRIAIAIEHGQQNNLTYNLFFKDKEAIKLWGRAQPADWGYTKKRAADSRDYVIIGNSFNNVPLAMNLARTSGVQAFSNTFSETESIFQVDSTVSGLDTTINLQLAALFDEDSAVAIPEIPAPNDPFKGTGIFAGRRNIMMTEWGPYDFRYPLIWNSNPVDSSDTVRFEILGPKGKWVVKSMRGLRNLSASKGELPATLIAERTPGTTTDIYVELEYTGAAFTNAFGRVVPAGRPSVFTFRKYFKPLDWEVNWFSMDTTFHNPIRTNQLFAPTVRMAPVKSEKTNKLDYAWWGGLKAGDEQFKQFITTAESSATFNKGTYELSVTWDDAVRVYIDGKVVVDEWQPSKYKFDESPHRSVRVSLGGTHHFRVEHLELGGFACLSLKIRPLK